MAKKSTAATAPAVETPATAAQPAAPAPAATPDAVGSKKGKKEAKPKVELVTQNNVSRPQDGTRTARVWEIADELSAAAGKPCKRKEVIEKALAEDLNAATAATQYGRWRKFHGLVGSDEKSE